MIVSIHTYSMNRLPREAVEFPSLGGFKRYMAVMLRDTVQWWTWQCRLMVGSDELRGLFQPKRFSDAVLSVHYVRVCSQFYHGHRAQTIPRHVTATPRSGAHAIFKERNIA